MKVAPPREPRPVQFRCKCPGCNKQHEAFVRLDKHGNLYLQCSICRGRMFGSIMIAKMVDKDGGMYAVELVDMTPYEFDDMMDRFTR